jgi:hypothetical protein
VGVAGVLESFNRAMVQTTQGACRKARERMEELLLAGKSR